MMTSLQRREIRAIGAGALIVALLLLVGGGALTALSGIGRQAAAPAAQPDAGIMHDADNASSGPGSALVASTGQMLLPSAQEGHESKPYLVLFVLDGARPDYFNVPGIPHIRALMKHGTQYTNAFAGILESETPTGHASISSGSNPSADGILSFAWANEDNTTVNLFDPANIRNGQMERILHNAPAPSIAGLVHAADPSAEVVALGGHKYYADDALGGPSANVIMYYQGTPKGKFAPTFVPGHAPPPAVLQAPGLIGKSTTLPIGTEDHLAMTLARSTFAQMHERVMLMNVPEFDWPLGHVDGGNRDPKDVKVLMQGFDRDLGKLEDMYRKAGILDNTVFVITADHGFAPIDHHLNATDIEKAAEASGTSIVSDTFHTAGYMWLKDGTRSARAAENIARLQNPYIQSVYFKTFVNGGGYRYLRASGPDLFRTGGVEAANQYLLNSFDGPAGPDIVVLFTEQSVAETGGAASWKGDHGGAAWESQHLPLIISGPGVRAGITSQFPARLEDIAPTVLSVMGVPHTGMQGVPLADAVVRASVAERKAQQVKNAQLQPVVQALARESQLEVRAGR